MARSDHPGFWRRCLAAEPPARQALRAKRCHTAADLRSCSRRPCDRPVTPSAPFSPRVLLRCPFWRGRLLHLRLGMRPPSGKFGSRSVTQCARAGIARHLHVTHTHALCRHPGRLPSRCVHGVFAQDLHACGIPLKYGQMRCGTVRYGAVRCGAVKCVYRCGSSSCLFFFFFFFCFFPFFLLGFFCFSGAFPGSCNGLRLHCISVIVVATASHRS